VTVQIALSHMNCAFNAPDRDDLTRFNSRSTAEEVILGQTAYFCDHHAVERRKHGAKVSTWFCR
jgi:hypothetical protein